jgi:hypothetical protein
MEHNEYSDVHEFLFDAEGITDVVLLDQINDDEDYQIDANEDAVALYTVDTSTVPAFIEHMRSKYGVILT